MTLQNTLPLLVVAALTPFAAAADRVVPRDAKVYSEEMPEDLHVYLKAEILKKKIPLTIVASKDTAEFVLQGVAQSRAGNGTRAG